MNNKQFKKNEIVYYKLNGKKVKAKILEVHYDDIEPYYTISIGNSERQTVASKLRRKNKKYPNISASLFNIGTVKTGKDGNEYVVKKSNNGNKWIKK